MTLPDDINDDENLETRNGKKGDSGEGDADSFGRGKAGSAAAITLSAAQKKEVWTVFRELKGQDLIEALKEFCELPFRAAANCVTSFASIVGNPKSFAIVTWIVNAVNQIGRDLERTRERARGAGRDSRGLQQRKPLKPGFGMQPGPNGPTTR